MGPPQKPIEDGDLPSVVAFSLLFIVPVASVALGWLLVVGLDLWGFAIPGALILVAAPPLVTGAVSRWACASLAVARSTGRGFALGSGAIAVLVSLAAFIAVFSVTSD